jgi:hypothetical protein
MSASISAMMSLSTPQRGRLQNAATESSEESIFHKGPFLNDPRRTLSKVDLTFLKDHIPVRELEFLAREPARGTVGCDGSKRGGFVTASGPTLWGSPNVSTQLRRFND